MSEVSRRTLRSSRSRGTLSVRHNRAFERIAPVLWLRAGSGRVIYDLGEAAGMADSYGVLENLDQADEFVQR